MACLLMHSDILLSLHKQKAQAPLGARILAGDVEGHFADILPLPCSPLLSTQFTRFSRDF
jgi:hypothetical protein